MSFERAKAVDRWMMHEHYWMMYTGLYMVMAACLLAGVGLGMSVAGFYNMNDLGEVRGGIVWMFMSSIFLVGVLLLEAYQYHLWKKAGSPK